MPPSVFCIRHSALRQMLIAPPCSACDASPMASANVGWAWIVRTSSSPVHSSLIQGDLYYRIRFKILSRGANTVNLMKFRTATDTSIASISVSNAGYLAYRNDVVGSSVNSALAVSGGSWQTLQVHLKIAGTSSQIAVWFNDAPVSALTRTDAFGANPVGRLQLGENTSGLTYDIAFDDVVAALAYVGSPATATPTATRTRTPTPTVTPTKTRTPAPTPTAP